MVYLASFMVYLASFMVYLACIVIRRCGVNIDRTISSGIGNRNTNVVFLNIIDITAVCI